MVFKCFANTRITDQVAFLCVHAPRGHIYLRFLPRPPPPLSDKNPVMHFFAYAEIIFAHILVFPACAIEVQHINENSPTILKHNAVWSTRCYFQRQCCLILSIKFLARGDVNKKLSQKQSGTGCVTKWWCRLDEKGSEVVSLSKKKSSLSPGDKQIRFDSPPTPPPPPPSKAPLSVPRTKNGTFSLHLKFLKFGRRYFFEKAERASASRFVIS